MMSADDEATPQPVRAPLREHLAESGWEAHAQPTREQLASAVRHIHNEKCQLVRDEAKRATDAARARAEQLAARSQRLSNKIATGAHKRKDPTELRVLMDPAGGQRVITDKEEIKHTIASFVERKAAPPQAKHGEYGPARPRAYPWEGGRDSDGFDGLVPAPRAWLFEQIWDAHLFQDCVRSLKNRKAPGPDGVTNEVLRALPPAGQSALHGVMQLMWATACTPDCIKSTTTVLAHKKKSTLHLANYRRLGLENTVFKLWTKLITGALTHHAERTGMLSSTQAGFRAGRSTEYQLEMLTMALEDARLCGQDIFLLQVDWSDAFDTTNHDKLLQVMFDLGYGTDAVEAIKNLYTGVTTCVQTPFGPTRPIAIERGTIQGDSLSPFLFLLYLEPLLRWLTHGARGYRPKCMPAADSVRHALPSCTYADDLNALATTPRDLEGQASKISRYAEWADMTVNMDKSTVTGALYGSMPGDPLGATGKRRHAALQASPLERRLQDVRICGKRVRFVPPTEPFCFLGVTMTVDLNWAPHVAVVLGKLRDKAAALRASQLSQWRKEMVLKRAIKTAVEYGLALCPYGPLETSKIDSVLAGAAKRAAGLPQYTANAWAHAPTDKGGLGLTSVLASTAYAATRSLRRAMDDPGRRGEWTRTLLMKAIDMARAGKDLPSLQRFSVRLCQLTAAAAAGVRLDWEKVPPGRERLAEALRKWQDERGQAPADNKAYYDFERAAAADLRTLFGAGIISTRWLIAPGANGSPGTVRNLQQISAAHPWAGIKHTRSARAALWRLTLHMSSPDGPQGQAPVEIRDGQHLPLTQRTIRPELWEGLATALQLTDALGDTRCAPPTVLQQLQHAPPREAPAAMEIQVGSKRKRAAPRHTLLPTGAGCKDAMEHKQRTLTDQKQTRFGQYWKEKGSRITLARAAKWAELLLGKADKIECVLADAHATTHARGRVLRSDEQLYVRWADTAVQKWELDVWGALKYEVSDARPLAREELRTHAAPCEHCCLAIEGAESEAAAHAAGWRMCLACDRRAHDTCAAGLGAGGTTTAQGWTCKDCAPPRSKRHADMIKHKKTPGGDPSALQTLLGDLGIHGRACRSRRHQRRARHTRTGVARPRGRAARPAGRARKQGQSTPRGGA